MRPAHSSDGPLAAMHVQSMQACITYAKQCALPARLAAWYTERLHHCRVVDVLLTACKPALCIGCSLQLAPTGLTECYPLAVTWKKLGTQDGQPS